MSLNLLGSTSRVETPILYVTIGNYTFGTYTHGSNIDVNTNPRFDKNIIYPNYMKSITIEKTNGAINTYTINLLYAIRNGDDPNLLEKVFGSVSDTRLIKITYGDASIPTSIYKEEEAIITKITSNVNIQSSTISYTISCTSKALSLNAGKYSFGKNYAKPSDIIKHILYEKTYGLQDIFYGMRDKSLVETKGLIASDDKAVTIEAKNYITILDYLRYLVQCMTSINNSDNSILNNDRYTLTIIDDVSQEFGGPYFKITKVQTSSDAVQDLDVYDLEIGTQSKDMIINFNIEDNQTYSLLYNYANNIQQSQYIYRIDNDGKIDYQYSPAISNSADLMKTTQSDKTWWTTVTQYPISCTVTLKGLLRPAILMSYVRVNIYFYGKKFIASGLYIITKQIDTIGLDGSRTELKLTRIGSATYDN